ncbi:response regulator transcription factor [Roseateles violae]|uniref:Response regulator transcription factor n=1 Tax=Roseateles violae TaxID=3058042 RepID=A0ABT8DKZ9_9BURK|nr:response regulator transcription factor [Pelomonas sp. PFR6]MDN3919089.1 response regulator transcription factor [Pelomonas sp. PFR6]
MRLLLLEDDDVLGEGLRDFLRGDGHHVDWFTRLADASLMQKSEPYDALLVDWQLPDGSGLHWVRALRQRSVATPVLMLTARDLLSDRIDGLDSGADDYLVKPFEPEELVARLRAVARRRAGAASSKRRLGAVELDLAAKSATLDGQRVELTAREWTLLEALTQRAGRIVDKRELESLMLGSEAEVSSNALEVHVSSLRRKLGRELIETVRGLGYRLVEG